MKDQLRSMPILVLGSNRHDPPAPGDSRIKDEDEGREGEFGRDGFRCFGGRGEEVLGEGYGDAGTGVGGCLGPGFVVRVAAVGR